MTTQSFTDAQQAANEAYTMTLAETGDMAQAADDYKSVMSAYHAAPQPDYSRAAFERDVIAKRHGDMTGIGWPLQDMINTVNEAQATTRTKCKYPDWEGGLTSGEHSFDRDGYCNVCGEFDGRWFCHFCGIAQPAWAGDCLTCEQHGQMGDRD